MTTETKTIVVLQGAGLAVYLPISIDLTMNAKHPPMSVLVAAAAVSLALGVVCITANLCRDAVRQNPRAMGGVQQCPVLLLDRFDQYCQPCGGHVQGIAHAPGRTG
jgi:hypothetical protein